MPWSTTSDIAEFVAAASDFLSTRPVEHTPLLTEADYLSRRPQPEADQSYGWWTDGSGAVDGAFLRAPRHPPILTPMPAAAAAGLVDVLDARQGVGCDVTSVDDVLEAWERQGIHLAPRHRLVIHRLDALRPQPLPPGEPRTAQPSDKALLDGWFDDLMAASPGDTSDREYVVDDPLADGRIVLWEVDGEPRAMAGWTRVLHGMTRVSAVYAPSGDPRIETAVLAAASEQAASTATDVLVLAGLADRDGIARLAALGYRAVRERVVLAPDPDVSS
ncbi:hypothetical protein F0U44_19290 [Nocardioides humilatus]|uniref:N-acetyltransferase domain-containing protein n=1 Tax=Nocardioides humilatus TaxID=2607660 RepID=A0A5B1L9W0_9ACTN|nr:hypothetical protein [Nocardioides humilatus]KAA1416457.1 hypothetical protein F0U44_19290 [Nocardioides humilatus]